MKYIDFLSLHPQVYVESKTRAKNKFGGLLSLINILVIIAIFIYYFIKSFSGMEYNIKYFSENIASLIASGELTDSSFKAKKELYVITNNYNIGDCKIHPFLFESTNYYDDSNITKCNTNLEIDPKGNIYCFNFSFNSVFQLGISGNCTKEDGNFYEINPSILTTFININHKKSYPFEIEEKKLENMIQTGFPIYTSKNSLFLSILQFTPIVYKSNKIFSKKSPLFTEMYYSGLQTISYNNPNNELIIDNKTINIIYSFIWNSKINCDLYERDYISLMDTLSKIGGFFSPLKLFLSILLHFYSRYENNYQIVKSLILKKIFIIIL